MRRCTSGRATNWRFGVNNITDKQYFTKRPYHVPRRRGLSLDGRSIGFTEDEDAQDGDHVKHQYPEDHHRQQVAILAAEAEQAGPDNLDPEAITRAHLSGSARRPVCGRTGRLWPWYSRSSPRKGSGRYCSRNVEIMIMIAIVAAANPCPEDVFCGSNAHPVLARANAISLNGSTARYMRLADT